MAAARLLELAFSRRNLRLQGDADQGDWNRRIYPLIAALHIAVIGGTALGGGAPRLPWLAALLAAQPLRLWVLLTLGQRWNARGAVAPNLEVATNGPYAYVRHPNYTVVFVELLALPMAFGLRRLALASSFVNVLLLAVRIHDEEALLSRLPGYEEHFNGKARFVPGLL